MPVFPEEIDVFTVPHSRMKQLVHHYIAMLSSTDFADYSALESLLRNLHTTFREFKSHELIENHFIMEKLQHRLKALSITDTAVCDCHSDNRLSEVLQLVKDGYHCTSKSAAERMNYGQRLQQALDDFTNKFLPHMKEEEEVFQPMLIQYMSYDELKSLKEAVISEHARWKLDTSLNWWEDELEDIYPVCDQKDDDCDVEVIVEQLSDMSSEERSPVERLPPEVLMQIMSYLNVKELATCTQVSWAWREAATQPSLWHTLCPVQWARGDWSFSDKEYYPEEDPDRNSNYDGKSGPIRIRQERKIIRGLVCRLLPKIGLGVTTITLAGCQNLNARAVQAIFMYCKNLQHLDFSYSNLEDRYTQQLEWIKQPLPLCSLNLSGCCYITDWTLVNIGLAVCGAPELPSREDYMVPICPHTGRACPYQSAYYSSSGRCTELCIEGFCHTDTDDTLSMKPTLETLNLSGCRHLTDNAISCLLDAGKLYNLRHLDVSGLWHLSGMMLQDLASSCPYLHPEHLSYCDNITNGPYQDSANGCQNLGNPYRECCRCGS